MATIKAWVIFFGIQALLFFAVFSGFIFGKYQFAYVDIGSDSYFQFVPYSMSMIRQIASEGFGGWSFLVGLGSSTAWMLGDSLGLLLLFQTGSADAVPAMRFWVYLFKVILGGAIFFQFLLSVLRNRETAIVGAIAYSFCGFIVVNGQWDPEATAFIFFPLILWGVNRYFKNGDVIALPMVLAVSLAAGVFFVSIGAFLVFLAMGSVLVSETPWAMFRVWLLRVLPLAVIGYLLASPILLPVVFQMIDGARVAGEGALFEKIFANTLAVNDWRIVLAELGGVFHKDLFGVGSRYNGFWNYLEGPGFYFGLTLFLVIPQLWSGSKADRRILIVAILMVVAYFVFPIFRYAAMGFAAPYFRISTLWVTILLLFLAVRALDRTIEHGIDQRLLAVGAAVYFSLLLVVYSSSLRDAISQPHLVKVLVIGVYSVIVMFLFARGVLPARLFLAVVLCMVMVESVLIARPSFYQNRAVVPSGVNGYDDGTLEALQFIRDKDKGVFRVEKDYDSVSLADSLAQDYLGVKSYFFHSKSVVDFFVSTGLIPPSSSAPSVNYTNWLPNVGDRYMLNSLLGVKYFLARNNVDWPGFAVFAKSGNLNILHNDMALPFGVVQPKQVAKRELMAFAHLPEKDRRYWLDVLLLNAVIVDEYLPGYGEALDIDAMMNKGADSLDEIYFKPARRLQETGLQIDLFSNTRISGRIYPHENGILVFSIPYSQGWSLRVDGRDAPIFRANFGMMAANVSSQARSVELVFQLPGRMIGFWFGGVGVVLLLWAGRGWIIGKRERSG